MLSKPMERRTKRRQPCRMPVRVRHEDDDPSEGSFWLDSANLSPRGVFLHTELLFPVGERLELEFTIPGRPRPVRSSGRIVRVVADRDSGPGVAVALADLEADEQRALGRMNSAEGRRVSAAAERGATFDA